MLARLADPISGTSSLTRFPGPRPGRVSPPGVSKRRGWRAAGCGTGAARRERQPGGDRKRQLAGRWRDRLAAHLSPPRRAQPSRWRAVVDLVSGITGRRIQVGFDVNTVHLDGVNSWPRDVSSRGVAPIGVAAVGRVTGRKELPTHPASPAFGGPSTEAEMLRPVSPTARAFRCPRHGPRGRGARRSAGEKRKPHAGGQGACGLVPGVCT